MPFLRSSAKHAKPSVAPQAAVAGGLTAAFLLGDGGSAAHASAGNGDWDRLAGCESGGNWSINTGNGYYGGLQFDMGTWRAYGGSGRPDQNSRSEQIRVANRLHDARGWAPWPSCSRKLGLRGGSSSSSDSDSSSGSSATVQPQTSSGSTASDDRGTERASRSRRVAVPVRRATVPITGKYEASRRARVVVALATTTPPVFDGHVLSTADAGTYRIAVKHWQRRMAARGWDITVDGHFGEESASVARRFAAQKGLQVAAPGTVDKDVWDAAWKLAVS